ncbi:integral membrane sensor signal transduction histidine kinase [Arcobacter nitrofigilis DSM 7299]|uniref:histidine kinase n=1 Tax=Arcobacter nitrofigilis (strain ATCC 33309 / DSM 7299 / CCUG 15893 / LMG 7604 / NCTC 12251 / CI) TaxID=572480 RepID=D5V0L2_ARCNC|nr:HAMP domain-containing sensor histidine kinase [Arcobacter nitrofigilis]ADG93824.1 integral membrane sensor signal transduction histidine kinase [Arcobacter nitrofigilis DSM 7299]
MNKNEKKALFSFLFIYIGSTALILFILLLSYYKKEINMVGRQCSIEMTSAANMLKANILNAYMERKPFIPTPLKNKKLKYALFDKDKKPIYSQLENNNVNLELKVSHNERHSFHVAKLEEHHEENIAIKYIVIETNQIISETQKLKIYIGVILLLGTCFIACIGYLLAKLLLKPVREKVEQMDKFIKDSAHELNTPIAVLMTSASTLKEGRNSEKMLKYIVSSAKQISQLYNDMHYSAFSEQDVFLDVNIDFAELIKESVEFFQDIAITKGIKINEELESCEIFMDKTKTQKIVNNLISNAIKYSNKDSKIMVRVKNTVFSVEDFGIGIDENEQKEIFKRYKRGKNFEGGFGIGLDIVSGVCKEYDLKLSLQSKLNEGSTFSVDFNSVKK